MLTTVTENTTSQYTYCRDSDGVDDTWDIYDPYGKFVVSIRFWDDPNTDEAAITEARAKQIVEISQPWLLVVTQD